MSEEFFAQEAANWRDRALKAEAELTALKARRCETCMSFGLQEPRLDWCFLSDYDKRYCVLHDFKLWRAKADE